MNEIARIHLAKVPYDIELSAKKELEAYILALQQYAGDAELMQDIEIRITELLHARGVAQNGIISEADVAAIRQQLGEPEDFADEDAQPKQAIATDTGAGRTLYRDVDHAVLGGVLGGIAGFFRINPLWLRLAFIVLLIASFGTALLVYVLLWIIVPPARTAAEKLQLAGKPVTLSSIRELSEQEELTPPDRSRPELLQRIIFFTLGTISLFAAIGAFVATAFGVGVAIVRPWEINEYLQLFDGWAIWTSLAFFVASGLLLTALFSLATYAAFTRTVTKKLAIAAASIILAGILSFGAGGAIVAHQSWSLEREASAALVETSPALPAEFSQIKHLVVWIDDSYNTPFTSTPFTYTADQPPKASLEAMPGDKPEVKIEGTTAYVTFKPNFKDPRYRYTQASFKLSGPKLEKLTVNSGDGAMYTADSQDTFAVEANNGAILNIMGSYANVTAQTRDNARIYFDVATVQNLAATTANYSGISAAIVRSLTVVQPTACAAAGVPASTISLEGITSGVYIYNGTEREATSHSTPCGEVLIGNDRSPYSEYQSYRSHSSGM